MFYIFLNVISYDESLTCMFGDMIKSLMLTFCFTDVNPCCRIYSRLIVFAVIRLSKPALWSTPLFSFGRLNDWHCDCYEWTEKFEVNKSCVHAAPLFCNPAVEGGCPRS